MRAGEPARRGAARRRADRRVGRGRAALRTIVVLLTRDLRSHDHPALAAAARDADRVVPLFVLDPRIPAPPNRLGFLLEALADLRTRIPLVVRAGEVHEEVARLAPDAVYLSADVSRYARGRERRLRAVVPEVRAFPGLFAVDLDEVKPYQVFTPYHRAWRSLPPRPRADTPPLPDHGVELGPLPAPPAGRSPDVVPGGETEGRRRLAAWRADDYEAHHDALAVDDTSRLSPYLHLGCVSAAELVRRVASESFVRQLCWRDFFGQLLLHRPTTPEDDLRPRGDRWNDDQEALQAWQDGRTGYPVIDAGMRQLAREGWMHNRARLLTASFLTKHLHIDWRAGAAHFSRLLLDGDLASNVGNWQWVAGTGADTRPNRVFNPLLQARRHDPDGDYVRRYVPELAHIAGAQVHEPGLLAPGYPPPLVDHREAVERFHAARRRGVTRP